MPVSTCAQLQVSNLQKKTKAMYGSDLSLANATCFNFALNLLNVTTYVSFNIYPETPRIQTQTWFFTLLTCSLEHYITMPPPQKIFVSSDMSPELFKLDNSNDIDEDGFSKLTHSVSKNNTSHYKTSRLKNPV